MVLEKGGTLMYDKLVKRLRSAESNCQETLDCLSEAADAIEELSKPKWIPMTERLPKEGEFVLVYGDLYPNKHDGGVIAVSKRMDWNYWQGFGRERNITHWMPLPEPPKEE
jgi:hypothetical protein